MNLFSKKKKKKITRKLITIKFKVDIILKLLLFIEFHIDRSTILQSWFLKLLVYSHSAKRSENHIVSFVELVKSEPAKFFSR